MLFKYVDNQLLQAVGWITEKFDRIKGQDCSKITPQID